MNKFLNNLERKVGKWAIPNLTMLMIGCYVVGYILQMISPQVFSYMTLEPAYILRGQLWRIVTWILIPVLLYVDRHFARAHMGNFSL